jgi:hypothetical protein
MLMGKVAYRCGQNFTTIVIPAKCIETFCIGSAFPLNKAFGSVSAIIRGETIILAEITGMEKARGNVIGTYKRDEDKIEVILPISVCDVVFNTEIDEGELRIEVIDDEVLVSHV